MKTLHKALLSSLIVGLLGVQSALAAPNSVLLHNPVAQAIVNPGQAELSQSFDQSAVAVEEDDGLALIGIQDATFFGFNDANLTDQAKTDLDQLAVALQQADYLHGIQITGHADPIGNPVYNQKLAQQRADAVKNYLIEQGGIAPELIVTQSEGASAPLYTCGGSTSEQKRIDCLSVDRRADIQAVVADRLAVVSVTGLVD